jgi:hypothetical protein
MYFVHEIMLGMKFKTEFRIPPTPAAFVASVRQFISLFRIYSPFYSELGAHGLSVILSCESMQIMKVSDSLLVKGN